MVALGDMFLHYNKDGHRSHSRIYTVVLLQILTLDEHTSTAGNLSPTKAVAKNCPAVLFFLFFFIITIYL